MSKIIAIMGLSGVGKTTVARNLKYRTGLPFIISCTTRPIRPNEVDDVDYHFIADFVYDLLNRRKRLVAQQEFRVANGEVWKYAICKKDIEKDCIMVLTPSGVNDLRKLGYDVKAIYLEVDEDERLKRILNRNDNQSQEEIKRRSIADKKVFENFTPDIVIQNNKDINLVIDEIINFVEGI